MNKLTDTRRSVDDINYQDKLYAVPTASEQQDDNLKDQFLNFKQESEELPVFKNTYDKTIEFCSSWRFIFIFLALLAIFVIYSIFHYWFL